MKKLNLSGVTNTLSEKEMKEVLGGAKADPPIVPPMADESPCVGKLPGSDCSMDWSGGAVSGTCMYDTNTQTVWCRAKA